MFRALISILFFLALAGPLHAADLKPFEADAEKALQQLRGAMMQEMQKAMEIGPEAAIGVCRHLAPDIEKAIEQESGWQVRRTGLKVRNPENAPTEKERAILMAFELRVVVGQDPATLRDIRIVDEGGKKMVQFMQAVPMFDTCLACHGKAIEPNVMNAIKELYPHDQAVGYEVGEIRGAFSLMKPYDTAFLAKAEAAPTEWDRIAAMELPPTVPLDTARATGNPTAGRDAFKKHCLGCHAAGDLLASVVPGEGGVGAPSLCAFLQSHGRTEKARDCDIVAFLIALKEKGIPR